MIVTAVSVLEVFKVLSLRLESPIGYKMSGF